MTTIEALRVQMDNLQRELQRLQVENQRLRGDEQSTGVREEMEDLRQRLFKAEERALGAEQEAEQWRAEVEQLKETMETTRQEGEEVKAALTEQLEAKTTLVEQLSQRRSERQLELNNLRAQNELLHLRISESAPQVHRTEASISEASFRSTTVTSDVASSMLGTYSSPSRSMEGENLTEFTPVLATSGASVGASNADRVHAGLNVSATPFPSLLHTVDQRTVTANGTSPSTRTQVTAYNWPPPLVPLSTPALFGSHFPIQGSTVHGDSALICTGASQPRVSHTSNQVQPAGNVTATTKRGCVEVSSVSFQIPPVSKYTGNAEVEPFDEWLEQFELVASVCHWEGRAKLANLVTRLQG